MPRLAVILIAATTIACASGGTEDDTAIDTWLPDVLDTTVEPDVPDTALDTAPEDTTTADTEAEDTAVEDIEEEEGPSDRDGDTVPDDEDAFPDDPTETTDTDGDTIGDVADTDDDADTIPDAEEDVYGEDCRISSPLNADTDGDGIEDPDDPYPRDPWPEFIVNQNDIGSFYFFLSRRDGTFEPRLSEGDDIGDDYRAFTIADFDGNGQMDFIGHSATPDASGNRDMWYFYRPVRLDEFDQILVGPTDDAVYGATADVNNDTLMDIVDVKIDKPAYIASVHAHTYLNNGTIMTAGCVYEEAPSTACAFTRVEAYDVTSIISGEWTFVQAFQAIDVTGDDIKDLVFMHFSNGGNTEVEVKVLEGVGDGTFVNPTQIFVHNSSYDQSPANSIVFADFTSDTIGDVIIGLDDDGDPGQAWVYPGLGSGTFSSTGTETFDINPGDESGSDEPGATSSARTFDFDFDGNMDIMVGHDLVMSAPYTSTIEVYLGLGTGQFQAPLTVDPVLDDRNGQRFAIPTRLCPWYED